MKPAKFAYLRAENIDEALWALEEYGPEAAILAGGQSLVPMLNMRIARPAVVVDINGLTDLGRIDLDGALTIGALTRQMEAERSPDVASAAPLIAEAVSFVGHPAIRSRGTVGGNIAHADAASELPAVLVALDAEMIACGQGGERIVPADDFFRGHYTTALSGELLTAVRIRTAGHEKLATRFLEVARRQGDFALVGVAVALKLDGSRICRDARIALSGVAARPHRAIAAERLVTGAEFGPELLAELQGAVEAELDPGSDLHASAEYRKRVGGVLARRAVASAWEDEL